MKIAVVNDIHVGRCLEHNGKVRASSHLVENMLHRFLQDMIQQHSPDILVNLGDLIRSDQKEADLKIYQRLIENFKQIKSPVIHLLGNHELKKMALEEVEIVWQQCGFDQKSYGCREVENFNLIWLGLELVSKEQGVCALPSGQLAWLKNQLKQSHRPTIIFMHCPIDDQDMSGNFFYEALDNRNKMSSFLENQESIRNVISTCGCVVAVLQAHLHYFHAKKIDGISYITCPALGDNICGPNIENNIPEIYTILTFEKNQIIAKAFSEKYCFAGYEGA